MKIELSRGQISDIRYALSLAASDAIEHDCPISAKIFDEIRLLIVRQTEEQTTYSEMTKADAALTFRRYRLYCKNCVHCESNSDGTRCILKNRCVSLNAHAEDCSNYTEIQKP